LLISKTSMSTGCNMLVAKRNLVRTLLKLKVEIHISQKYQIKLPRWLNKKDKK
jgi:hypothetical protein